ncbi:universal stress protein [Pararhodospirillum oryzae]|uniref:Universal stress protein UspA n=1 Tax=Pararhodospirillum oryzae TaxID=478448 RepID=A0A512HBF0_9PROT|nr:universal stress protein [Pararhodospirillum oryzae]GEO82768.1 universal stress protein UspA [Pararhodospirillum oryzae]
MYAHILVPLDPRVPYDWETTLPRAVALARLDKARLHLLTVVPAFGSSVVGEFFPGGRERDVATQVLESLKARTDSAVPEDVSVQNMVAEGAPEEAVLRMAEQVKADLLVVGLPTGGRAGCLSAPHITTLVRRAPCSVFVVRE